MSAEFNTIQNLISFLITRADLDAPTYVLKLMKGDKGGYYNTISKELCIPKWVLYTDYYFRPDTSFCLYYISHELAHAYVGNKELESHGPLFYQYFNQLCPNDLKDWELEYFPQNKGLLYV